MTGSEDRRENRSWPTYLFGGRLRTTTAALLIAFGGLLWLYETYEPPPPSAQIPASEVVPPGFIPDPAYTWAPRTDVQQRSPDVPTTTPTTTPTTPTTPTSPTTPTIPTATAEPSGPAEPSPSPGSAEPTSAAPPTAPETSEASAVPPVTPTPVSPSASTPVAPAR